MVRRRLGDGSWEELGPGSAVGPSRPDGGSLAFLPGGRASSDVLADARAVVDDPPTTRHAQIAQAVLDTGSAYQAAEALGISHQRVYQILASRRRVG